MENNETDMVVEKIDERKKKVRELCNEVINVNFDTYYDTSSGKDITVCPFCGGHIDTYDKTKIEHKSLCGFIIARELLNNEYGTQIRLV